MKRNKRRMKSSRFATSSMGVASLILTAFIMLMIFFITNSRCSTIKREIGQREKTLQRLDAELTRERTKWDEMKVPERLRIALTRFGLEMVNPLDEQIVRMGSGGKPAPGQRSLARLRGAGTSRQASVAHAGAQGRRGVSSVSRRARGNGVLK